MSVSRIPNVEGGIQPTIVTAKGDLIAAVANASPGRLGVGSDGAVLTADSTAATGVSWAGPLFAAGKNKIINGDFNVNQRNFSSTTTNDTFGFDRWRLSFSGGTVTMSSQAFTAGTAPVAGYEGRNFVRIVTSGQSGTGNLAYLSQRIEDVRTFAGQTVTVSFWAKASTGTPKIGVSVEQIVGTGGTGGSTTAVGDITISSSWARYTRTIAIPSLAGATVGTGSNLIWEFWTSAGSDFSPSYTGIGIQNVTIDMWGVQVEAGSVATAFQTATGTIQGELAACQRYYIRWGDGTQLYTMVSSSGWITNSTTCAGFLNLPVRLRKEPNAVEYGNTLAVQDLNLTLFNVTNVSLDNATFSGNQIQVNFTSSGMTAARFARVLANNSTSGYLALTAEL